MGVGEIGVVRSSVPHAASKMVFTGGLGVGEVGGVVPHATTVLAFDATLGVGEAGHRHRSVYD